MNHLSWTWIALAVIVPPILGFAAAYPLWMAKQPILGNLTGTTVIFGFAMMLIMREHFELTRLINDCLDRGFVCAPNPSAFARYAIYSTIAMVQVMLLFMFSLRVEHRLRRRGYDPEWR